MFLLMIFSLCLQYVIGDTNSTVHAVIGSPTSIAIRSTNDTSCYLEAVSWEKNGDMIGKWPKETTLLLNNKVTPNGTLLINRVEVFHNGTYRVNVKWNCSALVSYYLDLSVEYPTYSVKQPVGNCTKLKSNDCIPENETMKTPVRRSTTSSQSYSQWYQGPIVTKAPPKCIKVWVGQRVELECDFVGLPDPRPRWGQLSGSKKFQKKLDNSNGTIYVVETSSVRKIVFENIKKTDQNSYMCTGKNKYGEMYTVTRVKVYDYNTFCGTPSKHLKRREKRIVGGDPIKPIDWPWQALISFNPPNSSFECGGVIISSKWILTAWHCVLQYQSQVSVIQLNEITVYVGIYKRSLGHEKSRQMFAVKKIHLPPVNRFTADSDLALLELCGPIFYSKSVRPICIANVVPNPLTECEVAGWGRTGTGEPFSDVLRKAVVPLVHAYECRKYYSFISTSIICAGFLSGGDGTCNGDSGSPLVCKRKDKYQWELLGVVGGSTSCDTGYTFYSNAVYFRQWIIDQTHLREIL